MKFDQAVQFILDAEGGYVNDPHDPGGETKYGISKRAHPTLDIKNLSVYDAKEIYRRFYWQEIQGDLLPDPWGLLLLDAAVNQGIPRAVKTLQKAIGVVVDGVIGPETIGRLGIASVNAYFAERLISYTQTDNFDLYGRGWFRRVLKLHEACHG